MKRLLSLLIAVLMLVSIFTACSQGSEKKNAAESTTETNASTTTTKETKKFLIGYSNRDDAHQFLKHVKDEFQRLFDEDTTVEVVYADSVNDSQKQIDQIDNFIAQGIDCLVVVPNDDTAIGPAIKKCNEKGIPVVDFSVQAKEGDFYFVGISDYDCGLLQGKYMAKNLPQNAKVLYLAGSSNFKISLDRKQGFHDGIKSRTDVKILSETECNYTKEDAMRITEDWIQAYPQFDAIVACSDLVATGAIEALKGAKRQAGVMVSGIDGENFALQAIKDGEMVQTVLQDPDAEVKAAFDVVKAIQAGKTPEKDIRIPLVDVTKENVDKYLK